MELTLLHSALWGVMKESVGKRIRSLRTEHGLTLAELSEKANLSISYLSQIERDKTTPSLSTLTNIARAFNVGLRHFFETSTEAIHIVRSQEQPDGHESYASIRRLRRTFEAVDSKIEVYQVVIQPHTLPEELALHTGEEFSFVLAGQLTITLADEQFTLAAGDTIHYDAFQRHTWSNPGEEPCVMIWARSPLRLELSANDIASISETDSSP
jgi:transcriptional regulator with XRE-family HTH domain